MGSPFVYKVLVGLSLIFPAAVVGFSVLPTTNSNQYDRPPSSFSRFLQIHGMSSSSSSSSTTTTTTTTEWSMIDSINVQTLDGETIALGDIIQDKKLSSGTFIVSCLSHFGDFNAWELTQQYIAAIESGRITIKSPVVLVGIGNVEASQKFADDLQLSKYMDKKILTLVADEDGSVSDALGCYKGWLHVDQSHKQKYPESDVNPYLKLLGMIFGFGSPGTILKVVYGYIGDRSNDEGVVGRKWVVDSLLQGARKGRFPTIGEDAFEDVPVDSPLRPFELATLRLQTGLHIVLNWSNLGPCDGDLFTRMGGTFVFSSNTADDPDETLPVCVWDYFDQGILVYANIEDIANTANAAINGQIYMPPTETKALKSDRKRLRDDPSTIKEKVAA